MEQVYALFSQSAGTVEPYRAFDSPAFAFATFVGRDDFLNLESNPMMFLSVVSVLQTLRKRN